MKRRISKIAGAVFLALAIALSQVPASFVGASGSGAEFKRDGNTLISYTGTAAVVSVPNGIKTISTDAFAGNRYIESVSVPSSVEVIENGAFRDCPRLDEVYFSEGLQTIESGAFSMCPELDTVKFSSTIMELGAGVFAGDDELTGVLLGKNSYFIMSDGALYSRDGSELIQVFAGRLGDTFNIPESVSRIERYAFWGCDDLEYVGLSSHLSEIPEYSFSNCSNLKEVSVPYSIRKIGAKAFEDCVSLEYISLPVSVTNIHQTAFDGCYDLKISAEEGTAAYEFARAFESNNILMMEQEETTISDNSIGNIYKDSAPGIQKDEPKEETEEEEEEEETSKEVLDVYNPLNPSDVSKLDVSDYYGPDDSGVIGKTRVVAGNAVVFYEENENVTESESVQEPQEEVEADCIAEDDGSHCVAKKQYYQASDINKVAFADSIEKIDDFAFARSSVKEAEIPSGVTHIGYGAFYHCENLEKVEIPATVETIEPEAFSMTKYLDSWTKSADAADFLVVGNGILLAYKGDSARVVIPGNVKKIAAGVFQNRPEITEVVLNDSLTEIGEGAFSGCTSLSALSGGKNLVKIADRAFSVCPIDKLTVGENVAQIGLGAFKLAATDAVVFSNKDSLPAVSYEKTATRLENDSMRSLVFEEVDTAVVADSTISVKNTVLDERYMGFRGIVVTIPDATGSQAKLVYCTMNPDESTGLIEVPAYVRVSGKSYSLTGANVNAFDAYESFEYWGDGKLKGIILPPSLGKLEDYDSQFNFNVSEETDKEETEKEYVTTVVLESGYENAELISAEVLDDEAYYILYVNKNSENEQILKNAVENTYGEIVSGQLQVVDLIMTDQSSNVPISYFGNTRVEVWIPISEVMSTQNICAVTLGEDGNLQTIYGTKQKKDDKNYFVFRTNHFSAYGIYAGIGEVGEQIKSESNKLLQKDESPETGEWFHPKWLLVIASLLIGLGLLIGGSVRRKI